MAKPLIIVESPTKERTLGRFLGSKYKVASSSGHIRDLPKTTMGVDVEAGFVPKYLVLPDKREVVKSLQKAASKASVVYLASDPDREGEAIAWHLAEALNLSNAQRIEFHEITPEAVQEALDNPRAVNASLVDAYQARRILDRLVGYELSPLLSKKIHRRGLSGGRVQSVALRLVCEREAEIDAFISEEYWIINALLAPGKSDAAFKAIHPYSKGERMSIGTADGATTIVDNTKDAQWIVDTVKKTQRRRMPRPPLVTSTLQRAASGRFAFSAKRTMALAQSLYEGKDIGDDTVGLITYMRTDSVRIAESAQKQARAYLVDRFGSPFVPKSPPKYPTKKGAQDAHEAIRPTSVDRTPEEMAKYLNADELKLYTMIWELFLASQMAPAVLDQVSVDIKAGDYTFRATGSTVKFAGFLALTKELAPAPTRRKGKGKDKEEEEEEESAEEVMLPELTEGQRLDLREITPNQHFTQPPSRYSEATLIAALEEHGIGRPSTYSPTLETIKNRKYAELLERKFHPTRLGLTVNKLVVGHFDQWVNTDFTAQMEEKLDAIEGDEQDWRKVLADFWTPFEKTLRKAADEMEDSRIEPDKTGEDCPECGLPMVIRAGRFGDFEGCSGYPECRYIKREAKEQEPVDIACDVCGKPMERKRGRFGAFLGCSGYPDCKNIKREDGKKAAEPTGIKCLAQGCDGELVQRTSRRGSEFFGCSRYPKCRFTSSKRPTGESCPDCGLHLMEDEVEGKGKIHRCSSKECKFEKPAPE